MTEEKKEHTVIIGQPVFRGTATNTPPPEESEE